MQLVLFHRVLQDPAVAAAVRYVEAGTTEAYLDLVRAVLESRAPRVTGDAWADHLIHRLLLDVNPFTAAAARGEVPAELLAAAAFDLGQLQALRQLPPPAGARLPRWPGYPPAPAPELLPAARALAAAPDWGAMAPELARFYHEYGTGLFCEFRHLRWQGGRLQGVADPDPIQLDDLVRLESAKAAVVRNTEQLLQGLPANNLLLYGPRGSGKSSLVKAIANRYGRQGLRLVELDRSDLGDLPAIFRTLRDEPQRFVIFVDDLSFEESEASFKRFKAALDGTTERRPRNVVIYATSNRRHLVTERWEDRNAPTVAEVHGQDALEEQLSLADRFVRVLFTTPDQEAYLEIVEHLARRRGLAVPAERLRQEALLWERWHNARSGRAAVQFIDDLAGRLGAGAAD